MDLLSQIVARAKSNKQRIVLPEAEEERTLCAADKALADDIADIILIGNPAKVEALAKEKGLTNIGKATLIDPENYEKSEELAEKLAEIRRSVVLSLRQVTPCVQPCRLSSVSQASPASAVDCCSSLSRSSMVRTVYLLWPTWP